MSKLQSVTVTLGATINQGNYQNLRPEFTVTAQVEDGDTLETVSQKLAGDVRRQLGAFVFAIVIQQAADIRFSHDDPERAENSLRQRLPLYEWLADIAPELKVMPRLAERCPACGTLMDEDGICGNVGCEKSPRYIPFMPEDSQPITIATTPALTEAELNARGQEILKEVVDDLNREDGWPFRVLNQDSGEYLLDEDDNPRHFDTSEAARQAAHDVYAEEEIGKVTYLIHDVTGDTVGEVFLDDGYDEDEDENGWPAESEDDDEEEFEEDEV